MPCSFIPSRTTLLLSLTSLTVLASLPANADQISSLPFSNTPEWTDVIFSGTSMVNTGSEVTLTTAPVRGVWFGNFSYIDPPAWNLGNSTSGNSLSMTASFSGNAADWQTYIYDGNYAAYLNFKPTNCLDSCYGTPAQQGLNFYYEDSLNPGQSTFDFLALDLSLSHTFDILLKDGLVSYAVDGNQFFAGNAFQSANTFMLIGDSSGSTSTGVGSMTISNLLLDTAPVANVQLNSLQPVPEGAEWLLLLSGMSLFLRRDRKGAAIGLV